MPTRAGMTGSKKPGHSASDRVFRNWSWDQFAPDDLLSMAREMP